MEDQNKDGATVEMLKKDSGTGRQAKTRHVSRNTT